MQDITTLDDSATAVKAAFPKAHVNVISDTGIEVYLGDPEACAFVQEVTDRETGETTGWDVREGWGEATGPDTSAIRWSEVGTVHDTLGEAAQHAIKALREADA